MHALGLEFGSAAQLSERPGSVWNCLWGNALKRSPGIIRKSRLSYPGPGFLSSATWPSLPKKHYNGLNQTVKIFCNLWLLVLQNPFGFAGGEPYLWHVCVAVCTCACSVHMVPSRPDQRQKDARGMCSCLSFELALKGPLS